MNIKIVKKGSTRPVVAPAGQEPKAVLKPVPMYGPLQGRVTCKADALRILGGK